MPNIPVAVIVVLLFAGAWAQCAPNRYGQDCTCTSDIGAKLATVATTLTCSRGVWTATGPVVINQLIDVMYDTLTVPEVVGSTSINIPSTGNLTMHVREHPDASVENGMVNTTGLLASNGGHVHLIFDRLEQGSYSIQFAIYGDLQGNPQLGYSSNSTEFTCRTFTPPVTPYFLLNEGRWNGTTTNTDPKCGFNKGSRDWAFWVYIGISGLAFALIVFSIFTCVITPWRKVIWYPPN